jgi:hypothetical protein
MTCGYINGFHPLMSTCTVWWINMGLPLQTMQRPFPRLKALASRFLMIAITRSYTAPTALSFGGLIAMPKGPRGESRPADVIGAAVRVARIATGEETEEIAPVSPGAALGKLGGQARARNLTAEKRTEIAKKGAAGRWKGKG